IFHEQVAATCYRYTTVSDPAIPYINIPAMEMNVYPVQVALLHAEVLHQVGTEYAPMDASAFCGYVAERTVHHTPGTDTIGARAHIAVFPLPVLFPGDQPYIFQRHFKDIGKRIKSGARRE